MKIVVNKKFGGFGISEEACQALEITVSHEVSRDDEKLIELIENWGSEKVSDDFAKLKIVNIPDETTDWEINDYDGFEEVTYVVNGLIYHM